MLLTAAQAQLAGISRGELRGPRYRRVLGSVYVDARVDVTPRLRTEAALLLTPGGVLSHQTAIALWAEPDWATTFAPGVAGDGLVHLSVRRDVHRSVPRVRGLRIHEVRDLEYVMQAGMPVTPPERTFLDVASYCDLSELVTTGDTLVRRTGLEPEWLSEVAASAVGVRGVRMARQAAALVRRGVDSPMESRLRLLLILAGLPEPEVGYVIRDTSGGWLAQPDLAYPELKIAIEYDGRHHVLDPKQWRRDIRRNENLEREGWLVRVITSHDLLHTPGTVIARITQDLNSRHPHPHAT